MSRMSITLPEPAMNWLKREAKRLGISISELIRRIIDNTRDSK